MRVVGRKRSLFSTFSISSIACAHLRLRMHWPVGGVRRVFSAAIAIDRNGSNKNDQTTKTNIPPSPPPPPA